MSSDRGMMEPADNQVTGNVLSQFVENVLCHAASTQVPVSDTAGTTSTTHSRDEGTLRQNTCFYLTLP